MWSETNAAKTEATNGIRHPQLATECAGITELISHATSVPVMNEIPEENVSRLAWRARRPSGALSTR
jgi:hypothetical protein